MLTNCHSYYSFKYGTISTEDLIKVLVHHGYTSFALTDINNTAASIDFTRLAAQHKVQPVVGVDFRNGVQQQYVAIAQNNKGYQEINEYLTPHLHEKIDFDAQAPAFKNAFVIYPFSYADDELRSNEFIGVSPDDLKQLPFSHWKNKQDKLVIKHSCTFRNKHDYNAHRLLRAIDKNTLLSKLPPEEQATEADTIMPQEELLQLFAEYPTIIENTQQLLASCSIDFNFGTNKNKQVFTQSTEEDFQLLKKRCEEGLNYRFPEKREEVIQRMNKELEVIRDLGFCAYFLLTLDIIDYARSENFYYIGRGSGANSLVAYLLRITNVDPIDLDLYFERFINPFRQSPPDFDIDFSWTDRDAVTRYIFDTYGYDRVVLLGNYITFKYKSAIREIAKVFGVPDDEIVTLQKNPSAASNSKYGQWVIKYSQFIDGFPSHCSIHSSGILISEEPISCYSSTELLPKGFPSTQFDMYVAEDVGLHKFDILSQRGLSKIKDSVDIIRENTGVDIDIDDIDHFKRDERIKELLKVGMAIGCFYVESPAMRMLLTKLKADDYLRLVAASSIIRPGVAKSGMMREYILRFQNPERREQARKDLPELYNILEETYGVMVYQEDVIKVAHYLAGLSLDEADVLRRGMSWKFRQRNEFWKVREKFFNNCQQKGYAEQTIADIWRQIESFANYAFAKGHSASYAVESYQALYLKAYYPREYMTATLNNGGGFYRAELYLHEARMHGAIIEAPCVNRSDWPCTIKGKHLFLGLFMLYGLEKKSVQLLLNERGLCGEFTNLPDFVNRVPISLEQLLILIRIDAFRFTGKTKKELLWDAHHILGHSKVTKPEPTLFQAKVQEFELPDLWEHELEDAFDELELLGFSLSSPFKLLEKQLPSLLKSADLPRLINKTVAIVGYLITRKPTRTSTGESMSFGTFLDIDGHWLDTVHFAHSFKRYPFRGPGCYLIRGKVVEEYGFICVEVNQMYRLHNQSLEENTRLQKPLAIGG
ncbi:DNA polymerase III subunit alpha [Carboxylicivirga sp. M1479]|uniref:DNA polymerase III subunit alpha n=1 Tax=Carboxylicivirga sp. M1479 TaxID=2594476 RepID=UPI001177E4FE|nr:DNA polymerase III subunit alpha [Carboxylicivirga sp. M1479]TRX63275.1 DNA polymerase III subunit alpha [Carboxylicivirga sp. M1479]